MTDPAAPEPMSDERLARLRDFARNGLLSHEAQECLAEIDRLRAAPQAPGVRVPVWQPIETAPKMRTILLFAWIEDVGGKPNYRMDTGFWHTGYEQDGGDRTPWQWGGFQLRKYERQPTHWADLPEPPNHPAGGA